MKTLVFDSCTLLHEFSQQVAPLAAEDVGSGEAAVSAAHTQVSDAALEQVKRRGQTALARGEGFTAGAADDGATLNTITTSVGQMKLYNSTRPEHHAPLSTVNKALDDQTNRIPHVSMRTVKLCSFIKLGNLTDRCFSALIADTEEIKGLDTYTIFS